MINLNLQMITDKLEVFKPCLNRPQTFPLYSSKSRRFRFK